MEFSELDLSKTYTYNDYLEWAFDKRLELIKGRVFEMGPSPGSVHQRMILRLARWLGNYLEGNPCEIFIAPFDVRLPRRSTDDKEIFTVVQPDIYVVCDPEKIDEKGCFGPPDIVVETLSPGNNKKDFKINSRFMRRPGYWSIG
jgi:Uma2 family endonuclease